MGVESNLEVVRGRIDAACAAAQRDPSQVRLIAVSKGRPTDDIRAAYAAGQRDFGENRVQELADKASELADLDDLHWSMIGHLQTNKVADVARCAAEVQSVDSLRLAQLLDHRLSDLGRSLPVLIQVNTSGEDSKSGVSPDDVVGFARELTTYPLLVPMGLMTIALQSDDPERVSACFRPRVEVRRQVEAATDRRWPELSMGMSGDPERATTAGATCVRVGTAIFGPRPAEPLS